MQPGGALSLVEQLRFRELDGTRLVVKWSVEEVAPALMNLIQPSVQLAHRVGQQANLTTGKDPGERLNGSSLQRVT